MLLLKPASSEHKPRKTFLFQVLSVKVICWFMQEKQMKEINRIQPFYK